MPLKTPKRYFFAIQGASTPVASSPTPTVEYIRTHNVTSTECFAGNGQILERSVQVSTNCIHFSIFSILRKFLKIFILGSQAKVFTICVIYRQSSILNSKLSIFYEYYKPTFVSSLALDYSFGTQPKTTMGAEGRKESQHNGQSICFVI